MPTTATEWLDTNPGDVSALEEMLQGSDMPFKVFTELPLSMKQEITKQLSGSFEQPYWADIAKTTGGDAEKYLRQGLRDGWSIRRIANTMASSFQEGTVKYARKRATNIARTEAANALNGARKSSMDLLAGDLGPQVPMRSVWLSVLGNTTRGNHADLDGVPADENGLWNLGGYMIPWPGHFSLPPEERCSCQCTITLELGMKKQEADQLIGEYEQRTREAEEAKEQQEGEQEGKPPEEEMPFDEGDSAQIDVEAELEVLEEQIESVQEEMQEVQDQLDSLMGEKPEVTSDEYDGWQREVDGLNEQLSNLQNQLDSLLNDQRIAQDRLDYLNYQEGLYEELRKNYGEKYTPGQPLTGEPNE